MPKPEERALHHCGVRRFLGGVGLSSQERGRQPRHGLEYQQVEIWIVDWQCYVFTEGSSCLQTVFPDGHSLLHLFCTGEWGFESWGIFC